MRRLATALAAAVVAVSALDATPARAAPGSSPASGAPPATAPAPFGDPSARPADVAPALPASPAPSATTLSPGGSDAASADPRAPRAPAAPADVAFPPRVVPTGDATPAPSDHDAVIGAYGVAVRTLDASLPVFARRSDTGCASSTAAPAPAGVGTTCPPVSVGALDVRHWLGRNLAITGGLAVALGGGRDQGRLLDTYFGVGPTIGAAILLGNWRHLAIAATPELSFVIFKGAGSLGTAYVSDLHADLEAELHFGFIGVPALSLGMRSGLLFRIEHAPSTTAWSVGVIGATSVRALVSDLSLRYYF